MTQPADDTLRMEPQDALRVYLDSDGFRLHVEYVRSQWGAAAVNRKVRDVLKELPPADHSATIQAIHGTADSILALFAWPEEEYERLATRSKQGKAPGETFAAHRRVG